MIVLVGVDHDLRSLNVRGVILEKLHVHDKLRDAVFEMIFDPRKDKSKLRGSRGISITSKEWGIIYLNDGKEKW